jgi:hydroxylamine reductase
MSMFCYQCQESANNSGCQIRGVCGKQPETAKLQDLLVHVTKAVSVLAQAKTADLKEAGRFVLQAQFATITNANFDNARLIALIETGLKLRDKLAADPGLKAAAEKLGPAAQDAVAWKPASYDETILVAKGESVGVLATDDADVRSLRELLVYGVKGIAAYGEHAAVLGHEDEAIYKSLFKYLAATLQDLDAGALTALVLEAGNTAVATMALLDKANTSTYGNPEITTVNIGTGTRPGILISGHDLHDMEALLEQTKDSGVDVYTHSEMLAANYYPKFKQYKHFVGNYGNAWWQQDKEFASFNGAILMTTNCIVPVKDAYQDRIWTTGMAGYPNVPHISAGKDGKKDFSALVNKAKTCAAPTEIEKGSIVGGFAHAQVTALADKVVDAVKAGAIKRFVVMAGCDGRHKSRDYFGSLADALPHEAVILTAGCAKYRYNKKNLGDIGGIPRVLDAGQCNDSYSLAVIALKLKDIFGAQDVNDLPIDFAIAWYEQKAVAVLLALLALGFKNIRLGPTLPAFLSPNVAKVLVDNFGIKGTTTVEADVAAIMA